MRWATTDALGDDDALGEDDALGDEDALGEDDAFARRRTVSRTTSVRTSGVAAAGWLAGCGVSGEPPDARATVASRPRASTVTPAAI